MKNKTKKKRTFKSTFYGHATLSCNLDSHLRYIMRSNVLGLRESDSPFSDVPLLWTISASGEIHHWDLRGLGVAEQYRAVQYACNRVNACLAVYEIPGHYSYSVVPLDEVPLDSVSELQVEEFDNRQWCIFLYGATQNQRHTIIQPYKGSYEEPPGEQLDYIEHDSTSNYMKMPWFDGIQWSAPSSWEPEMPEEILGMFLAPEIFNNEQ